MADVTINQLPDISPSPTTVVPISNGVTTGKTLSNNLGVPSGFIGLWSGSVVPAGWRLCDGSNGTPDLRDRFVVGSGSSYSIGNVGGSKDAIVVSHTHTASDSGHSHILPWRNNISRSSSAGAARFDMAGTSGNLQTSSGNANITVSTTGSSGTNANLPPYYALAFIMKI